MYKPCFSNTKMHTGISIHINYPEVHNITEGIIPANALHHIAKTHDNQMSVSK